MLKKASIPILLFIIIGCISSLAISENINQLNLVIYNHDFGLVNEQINVSLDKGNNEFHLSDIPERLEPESVILNTQTTIDNIKIIEQKFISDILNKHNLLNIYEGKEIIFEITAPQTGEKFHRPGKIIRAGNNPIIEMDGKIRFGLPGEPLFEKLPEISLLKPTLIWNIFSSKVQKQIMELSYLTRGFSWETHYNAVISDNEDNINLYAWFILNNNTGKDFKNARTFLLAGDINRAPSNKVMAQPMMARMAMAESVMADDISMGAIDDYYIFGIEKTIDVNNRETKQIEFFNAPNVPIKRVYTYRPQSGNKIEIIINIENKENNLLGFPLPAGRLKIYRKHPEGINIFTGEDKINHTAVDETISLSIGKAFDLIGEKKVMESKQIGSRQIEEKYQITLRNRKKEDVTIQVKEWISRRDWEMLKNSHPFEQIDVQQIEFNITVPAGEEITLEYQVRMRW